MKSALVLFCALLIAAVSLPRTSKAGARLLEPVTGFGTNPAGLRMWKYVPDAAAPGAPLLVALHGCSQQAIDYAYAGWNELADRYKFFVLYPEQTITNNPALCFNWFDPSNLVRGAGENLSIVQMIDRMKADHSIDAKRVFVTGVSAGAGETSILLATWPELFAAGAPIAGVPYDCASSVADASICMLSGKTMTAQAWGDLVRNANPLYTGAYPRVSVWQGTADSVVAPANLDEVVKQWTDVHRIAAPAQMEMVNGFPHRSYRNERGEVVVEAYQITGMNHGVPIDLKSGCGTAGPFILDVAFCSSFQIGRYFGLLAAGSSDGGTSSDDGAAGFGNASSVGASGCGCNVGGRARPRAPMLLIVLLMAGLWRTRISTR